MNPTCNEPNRMPRILLADDNEVTRNMLGIMLKMSNYDIDFAENGQEVITMWEAIKYDLILLDIQMPCMDGFEVTVILRDKERISGTYVSIVAMTGHGFSEIEQRGQAVGMNAYIAKPINFKHCIQLIGETLKNKSVFKE